MTKKKPKWATKRPIEERTTLHLREIEHKDPSRKGETIVEVRRGGDVLATIYGSREGVHIIGDLVLTNRAFLAEAGAAPGLVQPLLREDDICPWCGDAGEIALNDNATGDHGRAECPVCRGRRK